MSTVKVNAILDASGGNTATINSMTPTADSLQGFRNRIINGDMRIDQRNAGASVTISTISFSADRFVAQNFTDGVATLQKVTDAPTGFNNSIKFTTTTTDTSLASTQSIRVGQRIEGFNFSDLMWGTANAKTVTLSFWVKSSLTGTFGGSFRNSAGDRSYSFEYVISSADTWEYKTVTVAGDTTGTWVGATNGTGVLVNFSLGSASDRSSTPGSWTSNNSFSATGAVSVIGTLNATWYITGVQLEVGSVATPFERRDYGRELAMCQRYALMIKNGTTSIDRFGLGSTVNTTTVQMLIQHPVAFRAAPTLTTTGTAADYQVYATTVTACNAAPTLGEGSQFNSRLNFITAGGLTGGQVSQCSGANTNAYLLFSAEL
jgi:hypothetical protein